MVSAICRLNSASATLCAAALALWLRAQRAYQELGLAPAHRPRITRSNIITAEPMPGDRRLLEEFTRDLRPRILADLVRVVFDKMRLAGEAGSLLKIEEDLHEEMGDRKTEHIGSLTGTVIEIGAGNGVNFRYYPPGVRVVAYEPNPHMHHRLQASAKAHGLTWSCARSVRKGWTSTMNRSTRSCARWCFARCRIPSARSTRCGAC